MHCIDCVFCIIHLFFFLYLFSALVFPTSKIHASSHADASTTVVQGSDCLFSYLPFEYYSLQKMFGLYFLVMGKGPDGPFVSVPFGSFRQQRQLAPVRQQPERLRPWPCSSNQPGGHACQSTEP